MPLFSLRYRCLPRARMRQYMLCICIWPRVRLLRWRACASTCTPYTAPEMPGDAAEGAPAVTRYGITREQPSILATRFCALFIYLRAALAIKAPFAQSAAPAPISSNEKFSIRQRNMKPRGACAAAAPESWLERNDLNAVKEAQIMLSVLRSDLAHLSRTLVANGGIPSGDHHLRCCRCINSEA